jgi:mevalonate kinase
VGETMKEAIGIAPAKCILLGEHAVVYGYPAIATAIGLYSKVIITELDSEEIKLIFENFNVELVGKDLEDVFKQAPEKILSMVLPVKIGLEFWELLHEMKFSHIQIQFKVEFWIGAGLGASASLAVALYKALQIYYEKNYSDTECFHFSLQMEKVSHGNPSGIDNTICSREGTIYYKNRISTEIIVDNSKLYPLLIIYSGQSHSTSDALLKIEKKRNESVDRIEEAFRTIGSLAEQGKFALEMGDMKKLQLLMEENQIELANLDLMTPAMEKIFNMGKILGIRGLKMTGAGLGGCLIALDTPEKLYRFKEKLDARNIESKIVLFNIKSTDLNYGFV